MRSQYHEFLIEYWGMQMNCFYCKNSSLCYTKERKEMYGE